MKQDPTERLTDFLYEVGHLRKILRAHRQNLLTDDPSDNIASHSFRVAMIGWILAEQEGADTAKVIKMTLLHDLKEIRSNDHNWIHKRYVKVYEQEISDDQLGDLPARELYQIATEYDERKTPESKLAKDADLLDQLLLLREYQQSGCQEATRWLEGKRGKEINTQLKNLHSQTAQRLGEEIYRRNPTEWWKEIWTDKNR